MTRFMQQYNHQLNDLYNVLTKYVNISIMIINIILFIWLKIKKIYISILTCYLGMVYKRNYYEFDTNILHIRKDIYTHLGLHKFIQQQIALNKKPRYMLIVMQIFLKTVFQRSTSSCIEARFTDIFRHGELL